MRVNTVRTGIALVCRPWHERRAPVDPARPRRSGVSSASKGEIRVISQAEMAAGDAIRTEGMDRLEAMAAEGVRTLSVRTQAGNVTGWHHHGEHATYRYVLAGRLRLEFGPGGERTVEAGSGEFFYVPPATVHREGNPASDVQVIVGFRVGTGPPCSTSRARSSAVLRPFDRLHTSPRSHQLATFR